MPLTVSLRVICQRLPPDNKAFTALVRRCWPVFRAVTSDAVTDPETRKAPAWTIKPNGINDSASAEEAFVGDVMAKKPNLVRQKLTLTPSPTNTGRRGCALAPPRPCCTRGEGGSQAHRYGRGH